MLSVGGLACGSFITEPMLAADLEEAEEEARKSLTAPWNLPPDDQESAPAEASLADSASHMNRADSPSHIPAQEANETADETFRRKVSMDIGSHQRQKVICPCQCRIPKGFPPPALAEVINVLQCFGHLSG